MKRTRELLTLVLPLMAAGCDTGNILNSPPPPPSTFDPEGIYQGADGNGDPMLGIVTSDGTADFVTIPVGSTLPTATQAAILVPDSIVPDINGNFSVSFNGYSDNGITLASGTATETGTFGGLFVAPAGTSPGTLSGSYTVSSTQVNYATVFDGTDYAVASSLSTVAGTYAAVFNFGTTADTATVVIGADGSVGVTESAFGCNYTGTVSNPDGYNAYKLSFGVQSAADCANQSGLIDNLQGLGSLFTVNSSTEMFAIMSDTVLNLGVFIVMTKTS